jgi:hypothetical protein
MEIDGSNAGSALMKGSFNLTVNSISLPCLSTCTPDLENEKRLSFSVLLASFTMHKIHIIVSAYTDNISTGIYNISSQLQDKVPLILYSPKN